MTIIRVRIRRDESGGIPRKGNGEPWWDLHCLRCPGGDIGQATHHLPWRHAVSVAIGHVVRSHGEESA